MSNRLSIALHYKYMEEISTINSFKKMLACMTNMLCVVLRNDNRIDAILFISTFPPTFTRPLFHECLRDTSILVTFF